jgi:predicted RNA binding protein YcfA (HicA-like mRNA interferase family)
VSGGLPKHTTREDLIRTFKALGWEGPQAGKRHAFMKKGAHKVRIPNTDIHVSLLREILKQAAISAETWLQS